METKPTISKSSYIEGLRCPLSLWYAWHRKSVKPDSDLQRDEKRAQGDEVGALARQYFAGGVQVTDPVLDLDACIVSTGKFIAEGRETIFEAAAINLTDGTYAHIDALRKVPGTDQWDMIEVKSGTEVKNTHIRDLAFQHHVFTGAGYKIRNCMMMLVDGDYVRQGAVDPARFFKMTDVTRRVMGARKDIPGNLAHIRQVLADGQNPPSLDVSLECGNPFDCAYKHSGHGIPLHSVFNIYSRKDAQAVVRRTGSFSIDDIPDDLVPAGVKAIDIACRKSGREHVDKAQLQDFIGGLSYPLYYLDYETIMNAVPFFDGTRPYRQVPFQFSLHIQETEGGPLTHHEFLHRDRSDPRRAFVEALVGVCGDKGSVIVYNGEFEMGRNNELGADFPEYADRMKALNARVADLYLPFKNRALYHPGQQGSASIKSVLPSFTSLSYKDLEINNGLKAMEAYSAYILGKPDAPDPQKLFSGLLKYCERDTYAMVLLLDVIRSKASVPSAPNLSGPDIA